MMAHAFLVECGQLGRHRIGDRDDRIFQPVAGNDLAGGRLASGAWPLFGIMLPLKGAIGGDIALLFGDGGGEAWPPWPVATK